MLETEIGDQKKALEAYELAAGWYDSDGASALVPNNSSKILGETCIVVLTNVQ